MEASRRTRRLLKLPGTIGQSFNCTAISWNACGGLSSGSSPAATNIARLFETASSGYEKNLQTISWMLLPASKGQDKVSALTSPMLILNTLSMRAHPAWN